MNYSSDEINKYYYFKKKVKWQHLSCDEKISLKKTEKM